MTKREIFDRYFIEGNRDVPRMPTVEYAPYWDLTLNEWYAQGLDRSIPCDRLQGELGLDPLSYMAVLPAGPEFRFPAVHGSPIISDEADYEKLLPILYPKEPLCNVIDFINSRKADSDAGDFMFILNLNGFFWWPRTILGIEDHLVSFYEQSGLYHRICRDLLTFNISAVKAFLKITRPAFILLGEDMSYNHGPMIGKNLWDEFLKPYYLEFLTAMKELKQTVIYDSDGDISVVIPWLIECGFDGILPLERMAGVDVPALAALYPDFKFIGGFDKTVMKNGEAAMRAEFERLYPAMQRACYLPGVDHQTPPDVSLENYRIYIRLLHEYAEKIVKE